MQLVIMTLADFGVVMSIAIGLAQAAMAVFQIRLAYLQLKAMNAVHPPASREGKMPSIKWLLIVSFMSILSWAGIAYDLYDRAHDRSPETPVNMYNYGVGGHLSFHAGITSERIVKFADKYRAMLVVRIAYADRDRMTDEKIEKSTEYTISGPTMWFATADVVDRKTNLLITDVEALPIEYNVVILPGKYAAKHIVRLGDVEALGGAIISSNLQTLPPSAIGVRFSHNPP